MRYFKLVELDGPPSKAWRETKEAVVLASRRVREEFGKISDELAAECGQRVGNVDVNATNGVKVSIWMDCLYLDKEGRGWFVPSETATHWEGPLSWWAKVLNALVSITPDMIRLACEAKLAG